MPHVLENVWFMAAAWMGLAFLASLISIRVGISVALIEMILGILAGNYIPDLHTTDWINFLATFGSVLLTFLAGAEIDPESLRANLRTSLLIGCVSFLGPFLGAMAAAHWIFDWPWPQAEIAGIALSTTSVAVVYAVMVEKGYNNTPLGKMILAACFITDFGTVLALGILFADFNLSLLVFVIVTAFMLWVMPGWTSRLIRRLGATRVSEPEVKFIFLVLFLLGGLATTARSEAVLPAYLVGLVVAGVFLADKTLVHRMRSIAFGVFTPFYFLKAGLYVSLPAMWTNLLIIGLFLGVKLLTKGVGVWPLARVSNMRTREANYTTLLMATGLTFGTISALFGLQNEIIDQTQYTILVTAVILSAIVPTIIAQRFYEPPEAVMLAWRSQRQRPARGRASSDVSLPLTKENG